MVRIYQPEREDGLVEWRVPGKKRPTRTIRLDVTRSENAPNERNLGPKGEDKGAPSSARSVRRTGRAGEKREGNERVDQGDEPATEIDPA